MPDAEIRGTRRRVLIRLTQRRSNAQQEPPDRTRRARARSLHGGVLRTCEPFVPRHLSRPRGLAPSPRFSRGIPVALRPGSRFHGPKPVAWSRGSPRTSQILPAGFHGRFDLRRRCHGPKPVSTHGFQGSGLSNDFVPASTRHVHCDGSNTSCAAPPAPECSLVLALPVFSFSLARTTRSFCRRTAALPLLPRIRRPQRRRRSEPSLRPSRRHRHEHRDGHDVRQRVQELRCDRDASRLQREAEARERSEEVGARRGRARRARTRR